MINQEVVSTLRSIIINLKANDQWKYFEHYFESKRVEIVEELLKESGDLQIPQLQAENAKLQVYDSLLSFDTMLANDLK